LDFVAWYRHLKVLIVFFKKPNSYFQFISKFCWYYCYASPQISFIILDKLTVIRILIIDCLLAGRFYQGIFAFAFLLIQIGPNFMRRLRLSLQYWGGFAWLFWVSFYVHDLLTMYAIFFSFWLMDRWLLEEVYLFDVLIPNKTRVTERWKPISLSFWKEYFLKLRNPNK
jgi:hypothetical protein